VVEPPPGPSSSFGWPRHRFPAATPEPVAPYGPASQGAAAVRGRASGRDTELHRVAERPPVPPHVGSHDTPRRVAPPQAPWQSSGARDGQPSRVHPGTWRHVRCLLRKMKTPSRPPRKWLRGGRGLQPPVPVRKDGMVPHSACPPSSPVGADARVVRDPARDGNRAETVTTRGYPTPRGVRIFGRIEALEGETPRAPPARNKAGWDRGGVQGVIR
jgi:hypothetical protein